MLEIKDLTLIVNQKEIIKNLSFVINSNDKIAIIGEEGNGKSSLLMAMLGGCEYAKVTGIVNTKNNSIGYLKQFIDQLDLEKNVHNHLFKS